MTCPECGKELPDGAIFCPLCGAKLSAEKGIPSRNSGLRKVVSTKAKRGGRKAKSSKGAKIQPKAKPLVLVDGSNVIWYGEKARLKNLQLLMRKLREDGYRYSVYVDASVKYDLDDDSEERAFQRMISDGTVQEVPAKTPADEWILEYATNHPECRILSNDSFQDWGSKFPVVHDQDRFIRFMIVNGEVMLPRKEASPLPEEVDAEIYCGNIYTSYEDYHERYRGELTELKSVYLQHNPEPAPSLLERVKKMARTKDGFSIEVYLVNEEVKSVALIGYGRDDMGRAKMHAESVTGFFKGEVFIEKSVPIWGEGKSYPIPGVAVILRKSKRPGSKPATEEMVDSELMEKALKIVEIARFPELKQSIHNKQRLAKLLHERVLLPVPDYRTGHRTSNFSDELDIVTAKCLLATRGLLPADSPFVDLNRYRQVKVFWEFVEPGRFRHREGGWVYELESNFHGGNGEVVRVVRKRTRVYLRRTEAAIEMMHLLDRYTQVIDIPK